MTSLLAYKIAVPPGGFTSLRVLKIPNSAPQSGFQKSDFRVLAEAAHKTGRAKADFELLEIGREEYERLRSLIV